MWRVMEVATARVVDALSGRRSPARPTVSSQQETKKKHKKKNEKK